jgi:TM2 domain-containing membrane protein YozV
VSEPQQPPVDPAESPEPAAAGEPTPPPAFPPPPGSYPPPPGTAIPAPPQPAPPPGYPYGLVDPTLKSRLVAGLLGIFLGGFGVHRFYLGYTGIGVVQILVTIVTFGLGSVWGLIEGILILFGSTITTDSAGRPSRW